MVSTPPSFPTLRGQGWSVHKKPLHSTRIAAHVSGREVRAPFYAYPLYQYEVVYNGLSSGGARGGIESSSLQTLMGFTLLMQGQFGTFLYTDPTDSSVTAQVVATGDGATSIFTLKRSIGGGPAAPVGWVLTLTGVTINGVPQQSYDIFTAPDIFAQSDIFSLASAFSLVLPNQVALSAPPPIGAIIAATFTYAFVCRLDEDQDDFEQFMSGLWQVSTLKFRTVKA